MKKFRPLKLSMLCLLLFFIIGALMNMSSFLYGSSLFMTDKISLQDELSSMLRDAHKADQIQLSRKVNIFQLDMDDMQGKLKEKFPRLDNLVLKRTLPNKLWLAAKARLPVAYLLAQNGAYLVDAEGIILSDIPKEQKGALVDYPVFISRHAISGKAARARRLQDEGVQRGLALLASLKEQGIFSKYRIMKFDITDARDIKFLVEPVGWIRAGDRDYDERVKRVARVLPELSSRQVKYIDLRFGDVVVGAK